MFRCPVTSFDDVMSRKRLLLPFTLLYLLQTVWGSAAGKPNGNDSNASRYIQNQAFIVAVDAGHGGKDGGAQGPNGTLEKAVVLAIAKKLAALIRSDPSMRSIMIRGGDDFIELRKRAEIAQESHADLFISLHADAYDNDVAHGSSVFTLSETGATSEAARCLADRENAAVVGGIDLSGQNATVASVLVDMSKNATLEASDKAAISLLTALGKEFEVHNREIQKANFVVLKSLDVPSVLIETGFISNPEEEARLLDSSHQARIARALFMGIKTYASGAVRSPGH